MLVSISVKVLENVCENTDTCSMSYTLLEKNTCTSLHLLIKSTHRSLITPVWRYLKGQDVYLRFTLLLTLLQGMQGGGLRLEDQSHEMRE